MIVLGTPDLAAALDALSNPAATPQPVEWVDWQACCPCGRSARWYARRVVDATGDLRPVGDGRQVSVEYRIDCACPAPVARVPVAGVPAARTRAAACGGAAVAGPLIAAAGTAGDLTG